MRRLLALVAIVVASLVPAPSAALGDQQSPPTATATTATPPAPVPHSPTLLETLIWPMVALTAIGAFAYVAMRKPRVDRPAMHGQTAHASAYTKVRSGVAVTTPSTSFRDVAGCEEAIEELEEVVAFLDRPECFARVKARMPR